MCEWCVNVCVSVCECVCVCACEWCVRMCVSVCVCVCVSGVCRGGGLSSCTAAQVSRRGVSAAQSTSVAGVRVGPRLGPFPSGLSSIFIDSSSQRRFCSSLLQFSHRPLLQLF